MEEFKEPDKITEAMKGGLARMYADEDFRAYLLNRINIENTAILESIRKGKMEDAKDYTSKMDALKKLLEKGKAMYLQAEKLKSTPLEQLVKERDAINQK